MTPTRSPGATGARRRSVRLALPLAFSALALTACNPVSEFPQFGFPDPKTLQGESILELWQGSAMAALAVGVFVWGLILWAIIAFRKRSDDMPRQVRYNLPVEVLYTVVPVVIVGVLFFYTAKSEIYVEQLSAEPDVSVSVVGFRWGWQFTQDNGTDDPADDVQVVSTQTAGPIGDEGDPVLVLPTGRTIQITETSPDVIHSFFVPEFLFKRDVIPGRANRFEITITQEGTFVGRCAELCGLYHDRMNFKVQAVSPQAYEEYLVANAGTINGSDAPTARNITPGTTDPQSENESGSPE